MQTELLQELRSYGAEAKPLLRLFLTIFSTLAAGALAFLNGTPH